MKKIAIGFIFVGLLGFSLYNPSEVEPNEVAPVRDSITEKVMQSDLSEEEKAQLLEDLEVVDVEVDVTRINKQLRDPAFEDRQDMAEVTEQMIRDLEREMNEGEDVEWTDAEKELIEEVTR